MNWPFPKNVLAVDYSEKIMRVARAKYFFGDLSITFELEIFSTDIETRKEALKGLRFEPEDIVVTSIGSGMILYMDMDVPPNLKRKALMNVGKVEATRVMGIPVENISVYPLGLIANKCIFAVVKLSDIETWVVERLKELGLPEPDVVIPDSLKYLYDTSIPTHGNVLYIIVNFFRDYVSNILVAESQIVGIRNISANLYGVFEVINNRFGITMEELSKMEDLRSLREVEDFLKEGFVDLALEINREVLSLLRSAIIEIPQENLDLVVLITDPHSLSFPLSFALSEVVGMKATVEKVKAIEGLLKRGGLEFGRVKSVHKKS